MTTRKRHTPERVVRKLARADRTLREGKDIADVCRELGVSEQTYCHWRNQFGGLKADDARRLKDLEKENSTLKRLLADTELDKAALKETARDALGDRQVAGAARGDGTGRTPARRRALQLAGRGRRHRAGLQANARRHVRVAAVSR